MAEQLTAGEDDGPTKGHNLTDIHNGIPEAFKNILDKRRAIAKAMELHVDHLKSDEKAMWSDLKTLTGMERKDLNLFFKLYERQEAAKDMDEEDRNRILDAQSICFEACHKFDTLDFIHVLETADQSNAGAQAAA